MIKKRLRLRFVGDRKIQWNILLLMFGLVIFTGLFALCANIAAIMQFDTSIEQLVIDAVITRAIIYISIVIVIALLISYLLTLMFAHKMAGPLYKLKLYLQGMRDGTIDKPLQFRADDELKDICGMINDIQDILKKKQ
jgi:signal transduction histidine kinase